MKINFQASFKKAYSEVSQTSKIEGFAKIFCKTLHLRY